MPAGENGFAVSRGFARTELSSNFLSGRNFGGLALFLLVLAGGGVTPPTPDDAGSPLTSRPLSSLFSFFPPITIPLESLSCTEYR